MLAAVIAPARASARGAWGAVTVLGANLVGHSLSSEMGQVTNPAWQPPAAEWERRKDLYVVTGVRSFSSSATAVK
jgi:hypothetical protein